MKKKFVKVSNFRQLAVAAESLLGYQSIERIGLIYGLTGLGKTTAAAYFINQSEGIYLRATRSWVPTAMLGEICFELGIEPTFTSNAMLKLIVRELVQNQRLIFIDEADYLFYPENRKLLDILRDIHDLSSNPIVLIGMEEIERKLSRYPQFSRRITQFVQFRPISSEDASLVCDINCEVKVHSDLLNSIYLDSKGSVGLLTVGLANIEKYATEHGWSEIDLTRWGNRPFFLKPQTKKKHKSEA